MTAKDILDTVRGAIRPYIIVTGWSVGLALAAYFAIRFADKEIAMAFILVITGAITAISSMYIGERAGKKKEDK